MSFTRNVKEEIAIKDISSDCCKIALLAAAINYCNLDEGYIVFTIEHSKVAKLLYSLFKDIFSCQMEIAFVSKNKLGKSNNRIYLLKSKKNELEIYSYLRKYNVFKQKICCQRYYLMGLFLLSGSVNTPRTSNYHLELTTKDEDFASIIIKLMNKYYLNAKKTTRRNDYVIYLKASEKISDFLRLIYSTSGLMTFEEVRIERDFTNSINRLDNCEIANTVKSLEAAKKQVEYINKLDIDHLEEKLAKVAILRLENPDKNLEELREIYNKTHRENLSKSGLYHRLNAIKKLAN